MCIPSRPRIQQQAIQPGAGTEWGTHPLHRWLQLPLSWCSCVYSLHQYTSQGKLAGEAAVPSGESWCNPCHEAAEAKAFQIKHLPKTLMGPLCICLPLTWLQMKLQTLATWYLKRWSGLAKSADTSRLFLFKANGGLDLPALSTLYKKLHTAKAASYMCSRDAMVRSIATQEMLREAELKIPAFRPFQEVVYAMKQDPGASKKKLTTLLVWDFPGKSADLWSSTVQSLPERVFRFALDAVTDTMPHNKNLHC